jgi:hypothetical protein
VLDRTACQRLEAGDRLLWARSNETSSNGGLPPVDGLFRFFLVNTDGQLYLGVDGDVIDEVRWSRARSGVAWQRDDAGRWCDADTPYGDGDLGNPGAVNPQCESGQVEGEARPEIDPPLDPDSCIDGDERRARVVPEPGDLWITGVMASSSRVPDARGEWFELWARRTVDLSGLQIGTDPEAGPRMTLDRTTCQSLGAGQRWLFARSEDVAQNGGVADRARCSSRNRRHGREV